MDIGTVPEPLEHSGVRGSLLRLLLVSGWSTLMIPRIGSMVGRAIQITVIPQLELGPQEAGEAIVVGDVGLAAPWFMMGWVNGVEVEFMIDTGCQVTILATSVFEIMCVSDPRMQSRLCSCSRRLVSADSSPLTVRGGIGDDCYFPGPQL